MGRKLYKYRPFSVNTLRCVTEAEVFYAQPNVLNDPLDCDPTIEIDMDRAHLERLLYRMRLTRLDRVKSSERIYELRYFSSEYGDYRTDPEVEDYLKRMLASAIRDEINRELGSEGVLSLSETWRSVLMWSYYADEHRGVCIEYDTTEQDHARLSPVNYKAPRAIKTSDLWRWKVRNHEGAKAEVLKTYFYSKSSEWRHEREWRDVSTTSGAKDVPFRITAILFGLRCDRSIVTSIVKLLSDNREIKLWQMLPKEDSFKLRRRRVDRHEIEAIGVSEPSFLMFKDIIDQFDDLNVQVEPDPEGNEIPNPDEGI